MHFNVRLKLSFRYVTVERRSAIILIFLLFSLFCQRTNIPKVLLILYTNFICPKSQEGNLCWLPALPLLLAELAPASTASHPGRDSRNATAVSDPEEAPGLSLTEAPQGARAPLKPKLPEVLKNRERQQQRKGKGWNEDVRRCLLWERTSLDFLLSCLARPHFYFKLLFLFSAFLQKDLPKKHFWGQLCSCFTLELTLS